MRMKRFIWILLVLGTSLSSTAQEIRSGKVEFQMMDPGPAGGISIRMVTPAIGTVDRYITDQITMTIICEVKGDLPLSLVELNGTSMEVNQNSLFTHRLELVEGENELLVSALDAAENYAEYRVVFEYSPPVSSLSERIHDEAVYYGLLIGIDEYKDKGIADLDNPIRDAQRLYETLVKRYNFDPERIKVLENPTRAEIITELDDLRTRVTPEDNLLIFYAGHGYWDEDGGIGYWLPSDASRANTVDWFRNSTLVDYLQVIKSKHTLLITDACFAGSIFKARSAQMGMDVAYERIYEMPSRKAMTSGTLSEVPDKSVFVEYLLKRLNENEELYLSSEELFSRIRLAVISNSSVVPQYGVIQNVGNEGGDFIFLRRE